MKLLFAKHCERCGGTDFRWNKHSFSDSKWWWCIDCGWPLGVVYPYKIIRGEKIHKKE